MPFNQPGYLGRRTMKPGFKPSLVRLKGRMGGNMRVRAGLVNVLKTEFHLLIQGFRRLLVRVFLQGKQVAGSGGDNLAGYFGLCGHCLPF
jgi:hypothetical protein